MNGPRECLRLKFCVLVLWPSKYLMFLNFLFQVFVTELLKQYSKYIDELAYTTQFKHRVLYKIHNKPPILL